MPDNELLELEIPQFEKVKSGKVREVFDMGESYLFVASDRVSACLLYTSPSPRDRG